MAAEIWALPGERAEAGRRFNEAAANGRGNLVVSVVVRRDGHGFNEAAANGRGNP